MQDAICTLSAMHSLPLAFLPTQFCPEGGVGPVSQVVEGLGGGVDLVVELAAEEAEELLFIVGQPGCLGGQQHLACLEGGALGVQPEDLVGAGRRRVGFYLPGQGRLEVLDQLRAGGLVLDQDMLWLVLVGECDDLVFQLRGS